MSNIDIIASFPKESKFKNHELLKVLSIETPICKMIAIGDEDYLYILQFEDTKKLQGQIKQLKNEVQKDIIVGENQLLLELKEEINLYFEGKLKDLNIPLKPHGTNFQKECWAKLQTLKFGDTMSYGELASRLGKGPGYSRAVGSAAGSNPLTIIIPCHRLIASGGKQGGFSSSKDRKAWLLEHEQKFKK